MSDQYFECIEHVVPAQHIRQYFRGTSTLQEEELRICVKQYKSRKETKPGDVTVIAAGANAIPKETYEPLWDALYRSLEQQGIAIRSIWTMDQANQGASGVLNEGKIGDEPSTLDSARDWLHIVNHFRSDFRFPIVGLGHSIGGDVLTHLAIMHPRLLQSLALVEPVMFPKPAENPLAGMHLVARRPDSWSSKDEAMQFLAKETLDGWDPRAMEAYRKYGLREITDPATSKRVIIQTTSKDVEIMSIARSILPSQHVTINGKRQLPRATHPDADESTTHPNVPFYRPQAVMAARKLPSLRPSCVFIYGGASKVVLPQVKENRRYRRVNTGVGTDASGGEAAGRVKEVTLAGGSHTIAQQRPDDVGKVVAGWWCEQLRIWQREQEEPAKAWDAIPLDRKTRMSREYLDESEKMNKEFMKRMRAAAQAHKAEKKKSDTKL